MEHIDARGQACPLPVVRAKKALSGMGEGRLEVLVDNGNAVHNLEALAASLKVRAESEQRGEAEFAVVFEKGTPPPASPDPAQSPADEGLGAQVAVVSSETMGLGDDKLGALLMKSFLFALSQQDRLPDSVLLYNGGVKLACEGSESLADLRALEAAGVKVVSCGLCLDYYELGERLAVGEVGNMYAIVEEQLKARTILRP